MPEAAANLAPAIELRGVAASSGGFGILESVDIAFPLHAVSVIMGGAGSGKSTLIKAAAGLLVPDSGTVSAMGRDMSRFSQKDELDFRAQSGYVFQDSALWANQSILNNVAMPLRVHCSWMSADEMEDVVRTLLKRLGYDESLAMRPAELSAGEQKLVSIARALVHDPEIVFMDDPSAGLDEDAVEHLFTEMELLRRKSRTLIVVTNNSDLAFRFADRLGVIKDGKIVAWGTYDETLARAEDALSGTIARLRARGGRARKAECQEPGSEMSQRGDV